MSNGEFSPVLFEAQSGFRKVRSVFNRTQVQKLWKRYSNGTDTRTVGGFYILLNRVLPQRLVDSQSSPDYAMPRRIYECWKLTSFVSEEFFADSVNESGVLDNYCKIHADDMLYFGAKGTWKERECVVQGGAMNPPFGFSTIQNVIRCANSDSGSRHPYCRTALLPLNDSYNISNEMKKPTFMGEILVSFDNLAGLRFYRPESFFTAQGPSECRHHWKLRYGLFIWVTREYLDCFPPPTNVEELYKDAVQASCCSLNYICFYWGAFEGAFPVELRSDQVASLT